MDRRKLLLAFGGAALAAPLSGRAQQKPMPVIGVLRGAAVAPKVTASWDAAFRAGLGDAGYVEGHNVVSESISAEGDYWRLPALAAELVARNVAVIDAQPPSPAIRAAKNATPTVRIDIAGGTDP